MIHISSTLQKEFEETKTVCFGRLTVEVPATANVIYGTTWMPGDIERYPGEGKYVDKYVNEKLTKINDPETRKKVQELADNPLYGTVMTGDVPGQKIAVGSEDEVFFTFWSFLPLGDDLYVQSMSADPSMDALAIEERMTVADTLSDLSNVVRNMRPRADGDIPSDPGLCLDGAFIADNPGLTHEHATVGIQLKSFPGVVFSILANKNRGRVVESNALEPRVEAASKRALLQGQLLWYASMRVLRRGQRQLGSSWPGFENLVRLAGQGDLGPRHDFEFVALGSPSDPNEPMLDVAMNTGVGNNVAGRAPISLSDDEAVALWDKLIGSIRVRPVGNANKVGTTDTPPLPLGELAATGRPCPQTGWWECTEGPRPVQGGRRRFFRAGDVLPDIVLLGQQSAWQKLKGEQPTHRMATVWQLVGHGES